jgi:hypothetical protein
VNLQQVDMDHMFADEGRLINEAMDASLDPTNRETYKNSIKALPVRKHKFT